MLAWVALTGRRVMARVVRTTTVRWPKAGRCCRRMRRARSTASPLPCLVSLRWALPILRSASASVVARGFVLPLIVLGLTVFLSVLGVVTPSPLIPLVTTGNVLGGMATLALLWWIGLRIQPHAPPDSAATRLRPWARLAFVVVAAQIALGAWTSGSFAGPSCTQLSGCEAASVSVQNLARGFAPARRLERDTQGKVITDTSAPVVHMVHRTGALLTFLYLGWLGWRARASGGLRTSGNVLLSMLALQIVLGLAGVATGLPLLLVTAHNAGAAMLLLAVVNLNHRVTPD